MEVWVVLILVGLLMLLMYGLWADHRRIDRVQRHAETYDGHSAYAEGSPWFDSRTAEGGGGWGGNSGDGGGGGDSGGGGGS